MIIWEKRGVTSKKAHFESDQFVNLPLEKVIPNWTIFGLTDFEVPRFSNWSFSTWASSEVTHFPKLPIFEVSSKHAFNVTYLSKWTFFEMSLFRNNRFRRRLFFEVTHFRIESFSKWQTFQKETSQLNVTRGLKVALENKIRQKIHFGVSKKISPVKTVLKSVAIRIFIIFFSEFL